VAQHIFACNELPSFIGGFDRGTYRRLLVIDFNRVIPVEEQVGELAKKILRHEMALVLAFSIDGAKRLLKNGKFTEPPSSIASLDDWAGSSDTVVGWAQDRLVDNRAGLKTVDRAVPTVTTRDAFDDFEKWYAAESYDRKRQPKIGTFTKRVRALGNLYGFTYAKGGGKRRFVGMILKAETSEMTKPERFMGSGG
jgi:phage/plasmid-associated DNA primase